MKRPATSVPERDSQTEPLLDDLEERIKLLVERYRELAERHNALAEMQKRLAGGPDPLSLQKRLTFLEAERERHSKHEAFLEERIRDLLARIRYVVEA